MTWHWCPYTGRRVSFLPMSKTSCVKRIDGDLFVIVRRSNLIICGGNATAAALISYFEYWHNIKVQARANYINENPEKNSKKPPTLLQFHSTKTLEDALMGIGKKHSVQKARELLVDLGIISIHRNPNPNYFFDNTLHYLFHPLVVNKLLDGLPVNSAEAEISQPDREQESGLPSAEISRTITNDASQGSKEEVPGLAPVAQKKVVKKKAETPKRPPRDHWQPFVDTWHDFYKAKNHGEEPTIAGKNLTDLGRLYDLLQLRARKKRATWDEKYMVEAFKFFLGAAWSDDWLSKHFLLSNLVEQFDAIYAREAEKTKKPQAIPFSDEIKYIMERWREGNLDERVLTPELYKKLEEKNIVPQGYREQFTGKDPDEQKVNAVKGWLKYITSQTTTQ